MPLKIARCDGLTKRISRMTRASFYSPTASFTKPAQADPTTSTYRDFLIGTAAKPFVELYPRAATPLELPPERQRAFERGVL